MRTIKVHGNANVMQQPDWMKISLNLNARDEDFQQAIKILSDSIDKCVSILYGLEIDKESLSIGTISVQHYKDYDKEKPTFHASQTLTLEQTINPDLVERLMHDVGSIHSININVNYAVKDSKKYERQALELVIKNATEEAKVICEFSNLTLGDIQTIEDVNTHVSARSGLMKAASDTRHESVNLDDVTINQSLTITWEIK